MTISEGVVVLGSRSPRRRELLALLLPAERIEVRPPADPAEPGFGDVGDWAALEGRLTELARRKSNDVLEQLRVDSTLATVAAVLTADTVIVGKADDSRLVVLGQPDDTRPDWPEEVAGWFRQFYLGRTHAAVTAVCLTKPDGTRLERVVKTDVTFIPEDDQWLDWYLRTGEPRGKAGGYALQGAGGLFVDRIDGSPSNVVGLPLRETFEMMRQLGITVGYRT